MGRRHHCAIGKVYLDGGDYRQAATDHIGRFYTFNPGSLSCFDPFLVVGLWW